MMEIIAKPKLWESNEVLTIFLKSGNIFNKFFLNNFENKLIKDGFV